MFNKILKTIIWLGLAVILFSPLYVSSNLFFPFIVTKAVAFNISAEIMFLAFLLLVLTTNKSSEEKYYIKPKLITVLFGCYVLWLFVSSFLGDNFLHSFWSNNERSEGIFLMIHLFLFLVVLTGFLRKLKEWLYAFEIFFVSTILVSLVALFQYFDISWIFESSSGSRLASTIGNAGYLAGFLIFGIFLGAFLFSQRKNLYLRIYYFVFIALEIFIAFNTLTRGGLLALLIAGFIFSLYLLFFYFKDKRLKILGVLFIICAVLSPILIFTYKESPVIQDTPVLNRLSNISLEARTAQTRLMTWQSAWYGFLERPVAGWGYENFYQVFDKHFNPEIYEDAGSVIWFDRAHNMIFDRLITGGIIGLLLYLSVIFLPFYYLWKNYQSNQDQFITSEETTKKDSELKNKIDANEKTKESKVKTKGKYYLLPVVFTVIILAYFIQNLFIFEALVIYIPLFLVLSFVSQYMPEFNWKFLKNKTFQTILFVLTLIVFLISFYPVNIRPIQANLNITKALNKENITINQRLDLFEEAFNHSKHPRIQEYRRRLFELFESLTIQNYQDKQTLSRLITLLDNQLDQQLKDNPHKVSYYLVNMRFNNVVFKETGNNSLDIIKENFELFEKAKKLSPNRQQVYFEAGYSYLYLGKYFKDQNQMEKSDKYFNKAVEMFDYAFNLNDDNFESARQLVNALVFAEKNQRIVDVLDNLKEKDVKYNELSFLKQIINTGVGAKNYEIIKLISERLITINSENPQFYVQLALAYAHLGEDQKAIETAQEIGKFGKEYEAQAQAFIQKVRAGGYK